MLVNLLDADKCVDIVALKVSEVEPKVTLID